jgi:hypothetical protein
VHTRVLIMAQQPLPEIEKDIIRVLHQRGKDYLTVRQIIASLSTRVRQQLRLTTRQTTADLVKKITPLLGEGLQVYRGPTSTYIGQRRSPAELILHRVQQRPGISPKQLGMSLPLSKHNYLTALNALLGTGTVICTFKDNHMPMLRLSSTTLAKDTAQVSGEDDRAALYAAYQAIGQGRSFVRIHRLRDALPWPRARFERVLRELLGDYTVELHGGDPSMMTEAELRDSFSDADGTMYIALSWRGQA